MFEPDLDKFKRMYDNGFNFTEVTHELLKKEPPKLPRAEYLRQHKARIQAEDPERRERMLAHDRALAKASYQRKKAARRDAKVKLDFRSA